MFKLAVSPLFALSLLVATSAVGEDKQAPATPATPDPAAMFAQLDTNKDGQLTSDEVPEDRKRLFERLVRTADKNQDGKLNSEEFAAGLSPEKPAAPDAPRERKAGKPDKGDKRPDARKLFSRLDTNGDGKLTEDEVPEKRREGFARQLARADKDGDKALSADEFVASMKEAAGEFLKKQGKNGDDRPEPEALFRRLDKNGDGKITADEVKEVPEQRRRFVEQILKRADKNGDGTITLEEFTAGMKRARPDGQRSEDGARRPPFGGPNGPPMGGLFALLDADHDGRLSSGEVSASAEVIRKLDKDGDGTITVAELLAQLPPPRRPAE